MDTIRLVPSFECKYEKNIVYKEIDGYNGKYLIFPCGKVFNTNTNKFIIPYEKHGYIRVRLIKNKDVCDTGVHRLIAKAFIPNPKPNEYNVVNHIDEFGKTNLPHLLEWCDTAYNINYGTANQRRRETASFRVKATNKNTLCEYIYDSYAECGKALEIDSSNISRGVRNKNKYKKRRSEWIFEKIDNDGNLIL